MMNDEELITTVMKANPWKLPAAELERYEKAMREIFIEGKSPDEALGFDKEMMEQIYSYGHSFYRLGKFVQANNIFRFVYALHPTNPKYAQALGASFHRLKKYALAVEYYFLWTQLDADNPLPFYYMIDCFEHLNRTEDKIFSMRQAIKRCGDKERFRLIKGKLQLQLEVIESIAKEMEDVKTAPMEDSSKGVQKQ